MPRVACTLIVLALLLLLPAQAAELTITQPGANETRIAELRDFYVYGIFNGTVTNPGDLRIELSKGDTPTGPPVRIIRSHVDPVSGITNASVLNQSYCNVTGYCTWTNGAMVPDLVKSPGGLPNPANKLVVTNRYYLGMIQGGVTKDFETSYTNGTGAPLADLTAGNYTIRVTGLSGSFTGQSVNETITLGLTRTALGRFSPASNMNAVTQYAIAHDRHVYYDWFPGYFTDPDNASVSWASPRRWTPNNGIEVVNDRPGTLIDTPAVADNAMFIYNINSASTSCGVELGGILKYGLADSPNTTFLYYDTGEPVMKYNDASAGLRTLTGNPVPFPAGRRLVLKRAEIVSPCATSRENLYDPGDVTTQKTLDFDPADGITVPAGKEFILYGATKPIASSVTPTTIPYRFTIDNRIAGITSTMTDTAGHAVSNGVHEVNLSRLSTAGRPQNSLWEFGIEVTGMRAPGTYTLRLAGVDLTGNPVAQTEETITVTVVPQMFGSSWSAIAGNVRARFMVPPVGQESA
jgi:hypothetical protein